jgi:biotin transport system substrate-specific component
MEVNIYINKYKEFRYNFFKWRYELDVVYKIFLAFGFACLTGLLAQFRFYLPGNLLVPITGQTFAVLLTGVILGKWGGVSLCMYAGVGALGIPWFTNFQGGFGVLIGSTGGYLIGFIFAAFFIGYLTDRYVRSRSFFSILSLMLIATFVLIYIPGLVYLNYYLDSLGISVDIWRLLTIGMIQFIPGDIVKAIAAASVVQGITPKRAYGNEVDA